MINMIFVANYLTYLIFLFPLQTSSTAESDNHTRLCKAVPNSPNWPSNSAWTTLNTTLNGRLLSPSPPALVCDPNQPESYDELKCTVVNDSWLDANFHTENPVSVHWPNWQCDACLPPAAYNLSRVCDVRPFPHYTVNATDKIHVAAALKFAAKEGVRLAVKNTGHDYLGR